MLRLTLAALALAAAPAAQTFDGRLEADDDTLNTGEFMDEFVVEAAAGDTVRAVVTSDAFDTYVIVKAPDGRQVEDDDCTEGETTRSCATFVADADGPLRVLVTSYAVGEVGPYRLRVAVEPTTTADFRP